MNKLGSFLKNKRFIVGLYLAPTIAAFSIALVMMPGIRPQAIDSVANSTADVVIGQPDMTHNYINQIGYLKTMYGPAGVASDGTRLFVVDLYNNRVLIYNSIPTSNNAAADVVIGQPDMVSRLANQGGSAGANTLSRPRIVSTDGVRLAICDTDNNRILIYNSIPTSNNAPADVVVGQPDFVSVSANQGSTASGRTLNWPYAVLIADSKLLIADLLNHRVLVYNSIPSGNNASAEAVIGQFDFESVEINRGVGIPADNTLYQPAGLFFDGTKLYIADQANHRVLIFNTIPISSNVSANNVIGQANFTSRTPGTTAAIFRQPYDVFSYGGRLFVSDTYNLRVLIYNTVPTAPGAAANAVIGQVDFTSSSEGTSNTRLYGPMGICSAGTKLLIADINNNRVLIYDNISTVTTNEAADIVIGQPDFTHNQANQADVCASTSLQNPTSVRGDGKKVFVCDRANNRVLIFNSIPATDNTAADVVIGQPDLTSNTANNGGVSDKSLYIPNSIWTDGNKLLVADMYNNRVLIYNTIPTSNHAAADVVIGQPDMTSNTPNNGGVSDRSMNGPDGVYSDGTRLFVAEYPNNRVLIYNTIPTSNHAAADVVIGQPDMTSNTPNNGGVSAESLKAPVEVYTNGTKLFVADYGNHRVLIYNTIPTSNRAAADVVLGQPDMTSNERNNGGISGKSLNNPVGVYSDGTRLFVADYVNNRVLIYNTVPTSNYTTADVVIGQPDMTSNTINNGGVSERSLNYPYSIYNDGTRLLIADRNNNRIAIYNINTTKPVISDVQSDGSGLVSGDTIRTAPVIAAKLSDTGGVGGIYINNLKITVDTTLYTYASFDASTDSYNSTTGVFTFKVKNTLSTGTHNVKIEVSDYLGNWGTFEANNLTVNDSSGTVALDGVPLNYPNPFNTSTGPTKITYKLTVDSDIIVYVFDVRGVLIRKSTYSSGSMGGKAGYNEITWDGKDDFGSTVGNGIYPYRIVSGGRVLGRGKIAVLE